MQTQKSPTVRELAAVNPSAARIFERFGIDYCCGGEKSLVEACTARIARNLTRYKGSSADWRKR